MNLTETCWICGDLGTTREHIVKSSDLRDEFGAVSQAAPFYMHVVDEGDQSRTKRNVPVGSRRSDKLKFNSKLCHRCNTTLTQPYDSSWETLSAALRVQFSRSVPLYRCPLFPIFGSRTSESILNVHLYFAKLFGCLIADHSVPIDIGQFSSAVRNGHAHPNLYLQIGPTPGQRNNKSALLTPLKAIKTADQVEYAESSYVVGPVMVNMLYCTWGPLALRALDSAWHPSAVGRHLNLSSFKLNRSQIPALKDLIDKTNPYQRRARPGGPLSN